MRTKTCEICGLGVLALCLASPGTNAAGNRQSAVVTAVAEALPCLASITTEKIVKIEYADPGRQARGSLFDRLLGLRLEAQPEVGARVQPSLGSGVLVHPLGYILTNFHVTERASRLRVTLSSGDSYNAVFIAGDEASDLALIKIEGPAPFPEIRFPAEGAPLLGETVIAMGNPFGLSETVTVGVLSSLHREARYEGRVLFRDILQTDAAINPGSSGGPLLDIDGRLIGVTVAIYEDAQNIAFAVPSSRVLELLAQWYHPDLLKNRRMGFEVAAGQGGLCVTNTAEGGGLRTGDIILSVDGEPVRTPYEFYRALLPFVSGATIPLVIERDGRPQTVEIRMAPMALPDAEQAAVNRLGIVFARETATGRAVTPATGEGLLIKSVRAGSPAGLAGVTNGDVLVRVNGSDVNAIEDILAILKDAKSGDTMIVDVIRLGESAGFYSVRSEELPLAIE